MDAIAAACAVIICVIIWMTILIAWLRQTGFTTRALLVWVAVSGVYLRALAVGVHDANLLGLIVMMLWTVCALCLSIGLHALVRVQPYRGGRTAPGRGSGAALLAIGCLLFLFLLPESSGSRLEPARRTICRNNPHQIILAMHNYHDVNGCFPPAVTTDGP